MQSNRIAQLLGWVLVVLMVACGGQAPETTGESQAALTGSATGFAFSAMPISVQAGTTATFTLRAVNGSGNTATDYTGKVHFTANWPGTVFSADYTFTPADAGAHTFQFTPREAGTQILYANDTVASNVSGSTSVPCIAASAAQYVISNLTSGSALNAGVQATFDVTAYDAFWNLAETYNGNAVITSIDPAAILPPNPKFTAGIATAIPITFMTAGAQNVTATDTVISSMTDTAWATVNAAPSATVTAPAKATTNATGLTASVVAQSGATYAWTITNGTITAGAGTSQITFSVGSVGTATVTCIVSRLGTNSTGTATVSVLAAPTTPTISGVASVTSGATGNTASVVAHAGMTYLWTISGGTITSAGGTAGVTSGGANTITYTAGAVGTIALTAVEINAAATQSAPATLSVTVVAAPGVLAITAPTNVTVGLPFTASAPASLGMTYTWTVNGTPVANTVANGVTSISYTPSATGAIALAASGTDGTNSAAGTKTVTAVAAPTTPVITAASPVTTGQTARTASVVARTGMTYLWTISGGTITSAGGTAGVTSAGVNKITYTAGPVGTIALTAVEINAAATASAPASASVTVVGAAPAKPTITAATPVTSGATGLTARVVAKSGMTYVWTITGGTITSAGGTAGVTAGSTNTITYTAGAVGTIALTCKETNGITTSAAGTKSVSVVAAPTTPVITVASAATSNTAGLKATVVAKTGMTYAWTITNGTITSAASGVTAGGINTVTFTSGSPGALTLAVTEKNTANATSAPGTATVTVTQTNTTPVTPTITLASVAANAGSASTAKVSARGGMSYVWTIAGGTLTSGPNGVTSGGFNTVSFTAGSAGTLTLTAVETNGTDTSAPASAQVNVVALPQAPVISAPASANAGQTGVVASVNVNPQMTYVWQIAGGTITSANGTSGVTNGGVNSITFTAGSNTTVSLSCFEVNSLAASSIAGTATLTVVGGAAPSGHVYVVAHQDDDLLFMNPDIEASIRSGHPTRVIYVTAAASPDLSSWQAREHGLYTPYMMMAGATFSDQVDSATYWTCGNHVYNNHAIRQCELTQNPKVSFVLLRLLDGALSSLWDTDSGAPFYVTPAATLTSADSANTYSKANLIATIAAVYNEFVPARISTLDSTFAYGDDHQDHVTSALLALEATHVWGASVETRIYRGYSIDGSGGYYTIPAPEVINVSTAEYNRKRQVMEAYSGAFANGDMFDLWCKRRYSISRIERGTGPIAESGSGCIDTQGGGTADGTRAIVATCNNTSGQSWTITPDYQITGPAGKCLTIASGGAVQLATCNAGLAQKWTVFANGQIRGQNGLCLADNGDATLSATFCSPDTSGNQWQPAAAQKFTQRASTAFDWSVGSSFTDVAVGSLASSYRSLQLTDLDGDGYSDACVRLAGGLACALNGHVTLGTASTFGPTFSDGNGWGGDGYGSTVQYADVNGDHVADACGRTATGIVCALGTGAGFGAPTTWTTEFSDSSVFVGPTYYRALHFADVDGDGFADVCGRTVTGVSCALNTKSGAFAPMTTWVTSAFADAAGWNADAYASTVQLADVDGDGAADVCGRGPAGLVCGISNRATAFTDTHAWSFRADFADATGWNTAAGYYGSIHFGDINGDGAADACGRGANGVVCGLSDRRSFQQSIALQPAAFTDALGWKPDPYGTSLRVSDVNHDGRADFCGRQSGGLVCSTMP